MNRLNALMMFFTTFFLLDYLIRRRIAAGLVLEGATEISVLSA